ncbi:MAG TPA: restriction endonuclease subunit S, partial [Chromatiales bacterium]|nr:restriction endonuclease subunit S [Chromatiales bacterium]
MSWEKKPLEAVADFCLGKMLDQKKNRGELLPYLANVNVRWGSFDLDHLREMRFEQHELERYSLKYGDIVMCEGGEPGRCAIWKDQKPGMMFQKALHRIRPHDCLNVEFLYYFFLYKGKSGHFAPLFTGSTIKHLPREKLAQVEVDVPPRAVQESVASILSAYDDLI